MAASSQFLSSADPTRPVAMMVRVVEVVRSGMRMGTPKGVGGQVVRVVLVVGVFWVRSKG